MRPAEVIVFSAAASFPSSCSYSPLYCFWRLLRRRRTNSAFGEVVVRLGKEGERKIKKTFSRGNVRLCCCSFPSSLFLIFYLLFLVTSPAAANKFGVRGSGGSVVVGRGSLFVGGLRFRWVSGSRKINFPSSFFLMPSCFFLCFFLSISFSTRFFLYFLDGGSAPVRMTVYSCVLVGPG
jgi:hypothetical protein